jgi:apolipoprotein N-acyltransferase
VTTIAKVILFLLGMSICVQFVAALYGFIDLKYTFRTTYINVLRRILIWGFGAAAIYWLLTDSLRTAFLWGMIGYFLLYVLINAAYHLLFARNTKIVRTK